MYLTACVNNVSKWGESTALARKMHIPKVSRKLPLRHGCVCRHTACTQKIMCMAIFIAGSVRPSYSVIKLQVYLEGPLQISRFFSVTRTYMHVRWDANFFEMQQIHLHFIHILVHYNGCDGYIWGGSFENVYFRHTRSISVAIRSRL